MAFMQSCSMNLIVIASLITEACAVGLMISTPVAPVATWGTSSAATAGTLAAATGSSLSAGSVASGAAAAGTAAGTAAAGTTAAGAAAAAGTAAVGTTAAGTAAGTAAAGAAAGTALTSGSVAAGSATAGAASGAVVVTAASGAKAAGTFGAGLMAANTWSMRKTIGLGTAFGLAGLLVGADADAFRVTWDCWKPMLHEKSAAPSLGRLLGDILNDPVISHYQIDHHSVFVRNRWNESWRIDPVILPWGQVAAHASQIMPPSNSSEDLTGMSSP
eukprot:TRINITY_DN3594_c0_g1_i2.p1 TRINITY_DN3594_c0_g1~~TRINITY_DN3594_c0_g1_i2.p1  ORF type:complete len:274 (-),score=30.45 TRINITY_DN3594_c0_g1_i2:388-1209(-)